MELTLKWSHKPVKIWYQFNRSDGGWVGDVVSWVLYNLYRHPRYIVHVNLRVEFDSGFTYVIDYGWAGVSITPAEEWDNIAVVLVEAPLYPDWFMDSLGVVTALGLKAPWYDFLTYHFTSKKPLVCTGFVQLLTGLDVTNPLPYDFLLEVDDGRQDNWPRAVPNLRGQG